MSEINKQKEGLPQKIALIICNGNPPPEKLLHQLWQEADYRVAADGGANQLYCYNLSPDAVVGDFDSIKPEVRKKLPNTKLFHVKEQDTNDADKAVRHCLKLECTEIPSCPLFQPCSARGGALANPRTTLLTRSSSSQPSKV